MPQTLLSDGPLNRSVKTGFPQPDGVPVGVPPPPDVGVPVGVLAVGVGVPVVVLAVGVGVCAGGLFVPGDFVLRLADGLTSPAVGLAGTAAVATESADGRPG